MAINNCINNQAYSLTATTGGLTATAGGLTVTAGTVTMTPFSWGTACFNATGVMSSQTPGAAGTVLTSNGATALPTYQAVSGGGLTWTAVTANVTPMVVDNGYIANKAATACVLTLPATATAGQLLEVAGMSTTGWSIIQTDAAHQILFGNSVGTTIGATGHLDSSNQYDCVSLVALSAKVWLIKSAVGNLTLA